MKQRAFLIFHLNLSFSSIEEEDLEILVDRCYFPLLDLVETLGIRCGIELTGSTLIKIRELRPDWIERFRMMIESRQIEIVGSGYCQIIGPLVPFQVNQWNQQLGMAEYREIVGEEPKVALVNEMAFSDSMVGVYQKAGYKGFIMERNNVLLSLAEDRASLPNVALDQHGAFLPIVWGDSIFFQKLQQFVHGDISLESYIEFLRARVLEGEEYLPIYCNDAEVFDYRPGRFLEESKTHEEGEWNRFQRLIERINTVLDVEWVTPSELVEPFSGGESADAVSLTSAVQPIPVKKQPKYNITRWAVTGRGDLWLNTMCHRMYRHLIRTSDNKHTSWRTLCEFWKSDNRTHITSKKWERLESNVKKYLELNCISTEFETLNTTLEIENTNLLEQDLLEQDLPEDIHLDYADDGTCLDISTNSVSLRVNLRRGLAIKSLGFESHSFAHCLGSIPHGHFSDIRFGADYYSAGVIAELPLEGKRFSDLNWVTPELGYSDSTVKVTAYISSEFGRLKKVITVSRHLENISITYDFSEWPAINASVRLGILTMLGEFAQPGLILTTNNGGESSESFELSGPVQHTSAASTLVSASSGFGATSGTIRLKANNKILDLDWDPSQASVLPMLEHRSDLEKHLTRIYFSMSEMDDTKKVPQQMANFELNISVPNDHKLKQA